MNGAFHLSIMVRSLEDSVAFFIRVLRAKVMHRDPAGYVNLDVFGSQITLHESPDAVPDVPGLHFGVNLDLHDFETLSRELIADANVSVVMPPSVTDAGTPLERRKMYLRCPTGYLIEIKGYPRSEAHIA